MTKEIIEAEFQRGLKMSYGSRMLNANQTNDLRKFFLAGMMFGYSETLEAATEFSYEDMCVMALEMLKKSIVDSVDEANKN